MIQIYRAIIWLDEFQKLRMLIVGGFRLDRRGAPRAPKFRSNTGEGAAAAISLSSLSGIGDALRPRRLRL